MLINTRYLSEGEKIRLQVERARRKLDNENNLNVKKYVMLSDESTDLYYRPKRKVKTQNVNNDLELRKKVTKYFYRKVMNDWIFDYTDTLQHYFIVSKGKVSIASKRTKKELDNNKLDLVVQYIAKHYIGKKMIAKLLSHLHFTKNINWYDMRSKSSKINKYILSKIKKKIKNKVE